MKPSAHDFPQRAAAALANEQLQAAMRKARGGFVGKRRKALEALPEYPAIRAAASDIRAHSLAHLDFYLERFTERSEACGTQVHWARDAAEARQIITNICREVDAKKVIKGKTMVGEEIAINDALEAADLKVMETDLGEYIIQLAKETPSHIIAPAVHKTRAEISSLFARAHEKLGYKEVVTGIPEIVARARKVLRRAFLQADVGITGANFLVAETGSMVLVTNEGNGDLSSSLPDTHIVLTTIEKVVPTLDDATTLLRVLARSATGQPITSYTSFYTGPKRSDDSDGPIAMHVVLLDNGRSRMLGGDYAEMLRCIRCGACLNHCPVYSSLGGHAYGWVYPGPMGAVLSSLLLGLTETVHLPNACTLNGHCAEVCPVGIPLPELLRKLREEGQMEGLGSRRDRWLLKLWSYTARHPRLYHWLSRWAAPILRWVCRSGMIRFLPGLGALLEARACPVPEGGSFQHLWRKRSSEHKS